MKGMFKQICFFKKRPDMSMEGSTPCTATAEIQLPKKPG